MLARRVAQSVVQGSRSPSLSAGRAQVGASRLLFPGHRCLSAEVQRDLGSVSHMHFKKSGRPHPLLAIKPEELYVHGLDKAGRNHVWEKEEIQERMDTLYKHTPVTMADKIMHKIMYGSYVTFNALTRFNVQNPSPQSCVWRLILLESVAGVPGFLAASHRHFSAIRHLKRDFGWINTLLEEAENERMHLMICMKMFDAGLITRAVVVAAQLLMTPFLAGLYAVHPKACLPLRRLPGRNGVLHLQTDHHLRPHARHGAALRMGQPQGASNRARLLQPARGRDVGGRARANLRRRDPSPRREPHLCDDGLR